MKNWKNLWARGAAIIAVLALTVAACGGGSDDEVSEAPPAPTNGPVAVSSPPNPNPGADDSPVIAGACLEGEPDCVDTVAIDEEPRDLPPSSDEEPGIVPSGGALVGGGLLPFEALSTDATAIIAVQGFLVDNGGVARLCELLAESLPPQCGGSSIPVTGYDEVIGVPLSESQGVTWTDQVVSLLGEVIDGVLVVDATVAG